MLLEPHLQKVKLVHLNAKVDALKGKKHRFWHKTATKPRAYVLKFTGDMRASGVAELKEEVNAVLALAKPGDEVIVRLESPGGQVSAYGLGSAQLERFKGLIPLTICVDKVAASGGYMMACVADALIGAPFAVFGSIGVVATVPNVHEWLKDKRIHVELFTAGEDKRSMTTLTPNTDEDRRKFQETLTDIHALFLAHVAIHRPSINPDTLKTAKHWYGSQALDLGLIDGLGTADALIFERLKTHEVYAVTCAKLPSIVERLGILPKVDLVGAFSSIFRKDMP